MFAHFPIYERKSCFQKSFCTYPENCPETVTLFSQEEINNDEQELDDISLHRTEGTQGVKFLKSA